MNENKSWRCDGEDKVRGAAQYAADCLPTDALWLRPILSPVASARLLGVQKQPALSVPGVLAVLTAQDFPGDIRRGTQIADQTVLPIDRLRYQGEIIGAAVAETPAAAEAGAQAVILDYQETPAVLDPQQAVQPTAPAVHPGRSNIACSLHLNVGSWEAAVKSAACIVERDYQTPRVEHAYLEPDCVWARWENGQLAVYSQIQDPHSLLQSLSRILALPEAQLRIKSPVIGGTFGGKTDYHCEPLAALAAWLFQRPAIIRLTRAETFHTTFKRQPARIRYSTAFDKQGHILGARARILCDNGPYSYSSPAICKRMVVHSNGSYRTKHLDVRLDLVYTNNSPTSSMRGYGAPQIHFAVESQMDEAAKALGMDPLQIRRRNLLRAGDRLPTGQHLNSSVGLGRAVDAIDLWRQEHPPLPAPPGWKSGRGVACMYYGIGKTGASDPATVRLEWMNGRLSIFSSITELGQGCCQMMREIASQTLQIPLSQITMIANDSQICPSAGITSASRITYTAGRAVADGCRALLNRQAAQPGQARYVAEQTFTPRKIALDHDTWQGEPYPEYAFACQLAEVQVNLRTGETRLMRVAAAHDLGRVINQALACGQIHGGIVMGAGYALCESYIDGRTLSFHEYIIPTSLDAPAVTPLLIEAPAPSGPLGAKGLGEPALVATAAAIINAIDNAVGVRIYQLPATAEKIFFAMRQAGRERGVPLK